MYVIAGLGNPGAQYENTKHNIGFITVDYLAQKHQIKIKKLKHKALVGEGNISGQKVLLVKPQTFMNLSGNSIREIVAYYKISMEELLIIYDDIDIPMGSLRIRKKGSAGTHNGMRSIVYDLQSDQFPRIRIGIGGERKGDLADYVIGGFQKSQIPIMEEAVRQAAAAVECMMENGMDAAMGEYNKKVKAESEGNA